MASRMMFHYHPVVPAPGSGIPCEVMRMQAAMGLDAFRAAVTESFVPLEVSREGTGPFAAQLRSAAARDAVFTEVASTPQLVERTRTLIDHGGSGYYKVSLLLEGSSMLVQDGRELVMRPGDLTFYDTSRPYSLLFDAKFRNLIMMVPKQRIRLSAPLAGSLTAVSISAEHELARKLAPGLAQAAPHLAHLAAPALDTLAERSISLVSSALAAMLDVPLAAQDPHEATRARIDAYIEAHLASHTLTPGEIATENFISLRHLHALFAELGTTVSTVIRERRVERVSRDLRDPARAAETIQTIAARWGFVDAAHFSRVFKQHTGVSPRAFRAQ